MTRRIVVVGDSVLDRDIEGVVERVSPDAPVPVVDVQTETVRPGGAGLAAALLARDGVPVTLVTTIGADAAGTALMEALQVAGVEVVPLPTDDGTREKVRVRSSGHSIVRLDRGVRARPSQVRQEVRGAVLSGDAVLVCDYAGGTVSHPGIRAMLTHAARRRPVVWDPHPRGSEPVPGCRLVTPNEREAASATGVAGSGPRMRRLATMLVELQQRWSASAVAVTLGADGAAVSYGVGAPVVVPTARRASGDTCGAGDRFAATAARCLAEGAAVTEAVAAAVSEAAAFVEGGGAEGFSQAAASAPADAGDRVAEVRAAGGTVVAAGGCFDLLHAGHVGLLESASRLGDCLVVLLNSDSSVRRRKGEHRPVVPQHDRVRVLEALASVDAVVVFDEDAPDEALRSLRPDVWVKGGDYALEDLPEAQTLAEWGGQCVVLPYLDGRSTSDLIRSARTPEPAKGHDR